MGLTVQSDGENNGKLKKKEGRKDIKQINCSLPGLVGRKGCISSVCMCVCVVGRVAGGFFFACRAVERDLPRKTVSLVVALVSPTLLEATHSYMASSRGVRNG